MDVARSKEELGQAVVQGGSAGLGLQARRIDRCLASTDILALRLRASLTTTTAALLESGFSSSFATMWMVAERNWREL